MPATRRSAARGFQPTPKPAPKAKAKRAPETESSRPSKRSKMGRDDKDQKTIEESMEGIEQGEVGKKIAAGSVEMKDQDGEHKREEKEGQKEEQMKEEREEEARSQTGEDTGEEKSEQNGQRKEDEPSTEANNPVAEENSIAEGEKTAFDEVKADESEAKEAAKGEEKTEELSNSNDSVLNDSNRKATIPSSILEKGIIYFFYRGRVNIDEPQGIDDIARSYIVLRPLPVGAKLGEGPLQDDGNARLLALPKKVLPKSKRDRPLVFVEKAKTSVENLKADFISGSEYATKTAGTSHRPPATPIAEGVYAITSTGRESHLAYHITIPDPLGQVQKDMGLNEKGSYIVSVRNPTTPAPGNVSLPKGAEYPESIMEKFRGLRWMPLEPELLDYENTQFLIIGEGMGNIDKATEEQEKDQQDDEKVAPAEEIEKLEDENQIRIEHLKGDDAVFVDLGLSSKQYSKLQTTW